MNKYDDKTNKHGYILKLLRLISGYTTDYIANKIQYSVSLVCIDENKTTIKTGKLYNYCQLYNMTVEQFIELHNKAKDINFSRIAVIHLLSKFLLTGGIETNDKEDI